MTTAGSAIILRGDALPRRYFTVSRFRAVRHALYLQLDPSARRIVAGITAVFSIGLIALPTGILASTFSDSMRKNKSTSE